MGNAAENPSALPLILLHDFYFVRRKDTKIYIKINGKLHKPDKLPLPLNASKMYFTRYCPDPLIVTLNPAYNNILPTLKGKDNATVGETDIELVNNGLKFKKIQ